MKCFTWTYLLIALTGAWTLVNSTSIDWETIVPDSRFFDVVESTQTGFAVAGMEQGKATIFMFNENGDLQWSVRPFPQSQDESAFYALDESQNGYVMCGYTTGGDDILAALVDHNGNVVWSRVIYTGSGEYAYDLVCEPSGSSYLACRSYLGGPNSLAVVMKLAPDGTDIWTRSWSTLYSSAESICFDQNGDIAVLTRAGASVTELVIYDTEGELQWSKSYTDESGNIIAADSEGYCFGGETTLMHRTNLSGDIIWSYSYPWNFTSSSYSNDFKPTMEGGFVGCGYVLTTSLADIVDGYIYKISSTGELEWKDKINRGGSALMSGIVQVSTGGYVTAGFRGGSGAYGWLVRFAPEEGIEEHASDDENLFSIDSPLRNPFSNTLEMSVEVLISTDICIRIHDQVGRLVYEEEWRNCPAGLRLFQWTPDENTPVGSYILSVLAENEIEATRVAYIK